LGNKQFLGEFEQMVMLAILQLGEQAHAPDVTEELERAAGRTVSQGALYTVLKRLEGKGLVRWTVEAATSERGGYPKRRFEVTAPGVEALRVSWGALSALAQGLDGILEEDR